MNSSKSNFIVQEKLGKCGETGKFVEVEVKGDQSAEHV